MNHSPFWPLVWKEYRSGRAFWLAMAVMGLAAQAGVAWLAHQGHERNWWLYSIALMISAGFAIGIGGTLFAIEHEDRTFALPAHFPGQGLRNSAKPKLLCALAEPDWAVSRALAGGRGSGWRWLAGSSHLA